MVDTDPDQFDCETCLVRRAVDGLNDEDAEAWETFQRVYTRFTVDWQLVPDRLRLETAGWAPDDVLDLHERLAIIYHELYPPKESG